MLLLFPSDLLYVYKGIEADIIDYNGKIDISEKYLDMLDFSIASMHEAVIKPGTQQQNTDAMIGALNNPYVDAIGHPGNPYYPINKSAVVKEAKRLNKLMEINNHSFIARKGNWESCSEILRLCRENDVSVVLASDAHICFSVGNFSSAKKLIASAEFPTDLIVNRTMHTFEAYLKQRSKRIIR